MDSPLPTLQALLSRLAPLSAEDGAALRSLLVPRSLGKSEFLLRPGDPVDRIYFLESGLLRLFMVRRGKEQTRNFFPAPSIFTESLGYYARRPSAFAIQALEDCQVWSVGRDRAEELFDRSLELSRLGRRILEWNLAGLADRLIGTLAPRTEDQYLRLRDTHPDWLQRVPQYMIASYLGVTPEALSRVISRHSDSRSAGT